MRADKGFLEGVFEHVGKRLNHEVEALLIGGNVMIYYGLKESTKDIDVVFFNRKDISAISQMILHNPIYRTAKVLKELPYDINPELLKQGQPTIIGNKDLPRFDLFYKYVFSVDTKEMFERASRSIRFELLKLKLAETEHLIFLKAVSASPVDLEDIIRICKEVKINWNVFVDFVKEYHKKDNRPVWFALGSFYDVNKKEKVISRFVIKEIEKLFKKELLKKT